MPLHENRYDSFMEINARAQEHFQNISPAHPQMQVKALPSTKEAIRRHELSSQAF